MTAWKKFVDIIMIAGMLIAVMMLYYVNIASRAEGTACMVNPLVYGAEKLSEANNADFIGSGYFLQKSGVTLIFNRYNQSVEIERGQNPFVTDWENVFASLNITK